MSEAAKNPTSNGPAAAAADLPNQFNTVGLISLILAVVSMGLCVVMFLLADSLPNDPAGFHNDTTTPAQLRLLILGCSTAVLATVALVMSVIALLMPNRSKTMALLSAAGSSVILLGVFGVIILAIVMANSADDDQAEGQAEDVSASVMLLPHDETSFHRHHDNTTC